MGENMFKKNNDLTRKFIKLHGIEIFKMIRENQNDADLGKNLRNFFYRKVENI